LLNKKDESRRRSLRIWVLASTTLVTHSAKTSPVAQSGWNTQKSRYLPI